MAGAKTLSEYAAAVDRDFFNLRNASAIGEFKGFEYIKYCAIENYLPFLLQSAVEAPLNAKEQELYWYKPKSLSKYLYGTENLYYLILFMNDMTVETFTPKKLKLIVASDRSMIESIINLEKQLKNI